MMGKFYVEVPFAGYVCGEVEADSAEEAIAKVIEETSFTIEGDTDGAIEVAEWHLMKNVVQGNVCYAPLSRASAEEIADD
jgi:hypothetical protein